MNKSKYLDRMHTEIIHERSTRYNNILIRRTRDRIEMEVAGGSFGSWHPRCILTAYYWDALAAGCLLHQGCKPKSILVLGLGGGTVISIIRHILPDATLVAVEIDSQMVDVACEYFNLEISDSLNIVIDDAYEFLRKSDNKFDIVIDDLFLTDDTDVCRADIEPEKSLQLMRKCLNPGGIVLSNLVTDPAHRCSQIAIRKAFRQLYQQVRILRPSQGANEIIVGGEELKPWPAIRSKLNCFNHPSDRKWWHSISVRSK